MFLSFRYSVCISLIQPYHTNQNRFIVRLSNPLPTTTRRHCCKIETGLNSEFNESMYITEKTGLSKFNRIPATTMDEFLCSLHTCYHEHTPK